MLFVLNIEKKIEVNLIDKLKNWFIKSKLEVHEQQLGIVNVTYINVKLTHKKIPWKKIKKILKDNNKILCDKEIKIPNNIDIQRYDSNALNIKLCKNAAIDILNKANINKENFKLVVYDPEGNHVDILEKVINVSRNIIVISDNKDLYQKEQNRLLKKYGISILVTDNKDWTYSGNFIIAPDEITEPLQISFNGIIFTGVKSQYILNGKIYDEYKISKNKYEKLKPKNLSLEYFLNVVYDKYKILELGECVPISCANSNESFSLDYIKKILNKNGNA